jgi:hypothetical protein
VCGKEVGIEWVSLGKGRSLAFAEIADVKGEWER